jgi:hypothetical protein
MSDTIGGGLQVSGIISRAERLLRSDKLSRERYDELVSFLHGLLSNPVASVGEKIKVADVLLRAAHAGDKLASEIAAEERVDGGKATDRKEMVIEIRFDDAG